jgi:hypothetical protein
MIIVAIDPGVKNLAIAVEYVDIETFQSLVTNKDINTALLCSETIYTDVFNITGDNPIKFITQIMEDHSWVWDICNAVLVERQIQFKGVVNNACLRIAHHCMSFLELFYPTINVIEYQSSNKTRVLNAPKGMSKPQRKKWSIDTVMSILESRGDTCTNNYMNQYKSNGQKLDDMCDCVLMCLTYCILLCKKTRKRIT